MIVIFNLIKGFIGSIISFIKGIFNTPAQYRAQIRRIKRGAAVSVLFAFILGALVGVVAAYLVGSTSEGEKIKAKLDTAKGKYLKLVGSGIQE